MISTIRNSKNSSTKKLSEIRSLVEGSQVETMEVKIAVIVEALKDETAMKLMKTKYCASCGLSVD